MVCHQYQTRWNHQYTVLVRVEPFMIMVGVSIGPVRIMVSSAFEGHDWLGCTHNIRVQGWGLFEPSNCKVMVLSQWASMWALGKGKGQFWSTSFVPIDRAHLNHP